MLCTQRRTTDRLLCTWLQAAEPHGHGLSATKARPVAGASKLQAALQRSRAARMQATARKRQAPPELTMTLTMATGQAPPPQAQKLRRGQPRVVPWRKTAALERLRTAARESHLAQSRTQHASALAQRRSQAAAMAPSAHTSPAATLQVPSAATVPAPSAAQRSRAAASAHSSAHRRRAPAEKLSVQASSMHRASHRALKRVSTQRRALAGKASTMSESLRAVAVEAQLMQRRTLYAEGLSPEYCQTPGSTNPAPQDGVASGAHTRSRQRAQHQVSLQVICAQSLLLTDVVVSVRRC